TGAPPPQVHIEFLDANQNILVGFDKLDPKDPLAVPSDPRQAIGVQVLGNQVALLQKARRFFVLITPLTVATQYGVNIPTRPEESPVVLLIPQGGGTVKPLWPTNPRTGAVLRPQFRGRAGYFGQQLRGGDERHAPI